MRAHIDYYFCLISPFSFMGLARLREYAARTGSTIHYKPVDLPKLFLATGGVPLAKRPESRKQYRIVELERWRLYLSIDLNLEPDYFPADESLAARVVAAVVNDGLDPGDLCHAFHEAVWTRQRNIADPEVIRTVLSETGYPEAMFDRAAGDTPSQTIDANTNEAAGLGVLGVPTYVIDGEMFWGQDRLDFVARKLGLRQ